MTPPTLPPVKRTIDVSWTPEASFKRFTEQFGAWWPHKTHSIGGKRVARIVFETRLGGLIYEELDDGRRFQWGEVTLWDPPHRLAFTFHPSLDRAKAQDVSVEFEPDGRGTSVNLVSTGWERLGPKGRKLARRAYDAGWGYILNIWAERRTNRMLVMEAVAGAVGLFNRLRPGGIERQIARAEGEIAPAPGAKS